MSPSAPPPTVGRAFLDDCARRADECLARIRHCVDQLTDEQVWWRPREEMNAIGNLLLHLCGNLTQWIVHGVPQKPDTRDRPREFTERGRIPKGELLARLERTVAEVKEVLRGCEGALLEPRRIQAHDETVLSAISHSIGHLAGHTQEIVYITRLQLGDKYRFAWVPKTREQGAPA